MPARNTGRSNKPDSASGKSNVPPYFKVLDPLDGGYAYGRVIKADNGNEFDEFEINIYDDRADRGQHRKAIQVQVRKTGKFGSTTVISLDSVDKFSELVDDLAGALGVMQAATPKAKSKGRKS